MADHPLRNWIPYKIALNDGPARCNWLDTHGQRFTEPFFEDTIKKCRVMDHRHAKMASVSDLAMLGEWAGDIDAVMPGAAVFHISRCGSTLISQLLATSGRHIVLSEVPFLDDLLRLRYNDANFNPDKISGMLSSAVKFYGQKKTGREQHLTIKTDSWHIFFYEQLRQLYPTVPFILMYRKPDEVFRSHSKLRGMQAVPGLIEPQVFGFDPAEIDYRNFDKYLADVLEGYLNRYLEIIETDKQCLLVNYNEGPMPILKKIAAFTGYQFCEDEIGVMEERSGYHSKKPGERFVVEEKMVTPDFLQPAMKLYEKLEEVRKSGYQV